MSVRLSIFALCLLLPLSAQAQQQRQEISFDQAWRQLQTVSDKLKANEAQVSRAAALKRSGDALDYPSVGISGTYTHLDKPVELDLRDLNPLASLNSGELPITIPPALGNLLQGLPMVTPLTEQDIFRASLQALWPIYTGGKISAAQSIQKAQVAKQQQASELAKRELFTTLVDRYYGVIVTHKAWQTQQLLVDALSEHLEHAVKLEAQGQIAKVERLNAEVALSNAKVNAASAMRQYQMAQFALNRMLHTEQSEPDSRLFMLKTDPSLPQLTQLTLAQHPALKLLEAKEAQAQGLVEVEKSLYLPTVFLYGNYTLYEDDSLASQMEPDWLVGVGVKMPIISNSGRGDKVEAAKSALLQARYTKAQTRQDLSLLLDQSFRQLEQAREEVISLNTSLTLAEENLRLRELAFNQGMSTSVERVDAQVKLTGVQTQQLAATYRYVQAYAKLMAVSGQLDEFIARSSQSTEWRLHTEHKDGENHDAR
ncbi:MAG: TolC family protein [Shewanella sp.]|nr:TolC family protein [Shewanella sp.]MCF1429517.1 TolC family protein [Shewanella sp.]MCF1457701.1 TolC family protein [Shewanella sp.]